MPDSVSAWVSSFVMDLPGLQRPATRESARASIRIVDGWVAVRGIPRGPRTTNGLGASFDWLRAGSLRTGVECRRGLRRDPSGALGMTEKTEGSETPLLGR